MGGWGRGWTERGKKRRKHDRQVLKSMGGAGRKLREGCVETGNEGRREGGALSCWSLRSGLEEGHVYGLTFFFSSPLLFFDLVDVLPSAKNTSVPSRSFATVR